MFGKPTALAAMAVLAASWTLAGPAPSALAADYGVDMSRACQITQNWATSYAYLNTPYNAYSWKCGPVVSGVDVQAYCNSDRPGTHAVVLNAADPYSWRCRT